MIICPRRKHKPHRGRRMIRLPTFDSFAAFIDIHSNVVVVIAVIIIILESDI